VRKDKITHIPFKIRTCAVRQVKERKNGGGPIIEGKEKYVKRNFPSQTPREIIKTQQNNRKRGKGRECRNKIPKKGKEIRPLVKEERKGVQTEKLKARMKPSYLQMRRVSKMCVGSQLRQPSLI